MTVEPIGVSTPAEPIEKPTCPDHGYCTLGALHEPATVSCLTCGGPPDLIEVTTEQRPWEMYRCHVIGKPWEPPKPSLADIEARVGAATPGPWEIVLPDHYCSTFIEMPTKDRVVMSVHADNEADDLALIAHAPTDLAALTAAVRAVLALTVPCAGHYHDAINPPGSQVKCLDGQVSTADLRAALATHLDLGGE